MKRNQNATTIVYDLSCLDLLARIREIKELSGLKTVRVSLRSTVLYCQHSHCFFQMRTTCLHHLNRRTLEWMEEYLPSPLPYRVEILPDGQLRDRSQPGPEGTLGREREIF